MMAPVDGSGGCPAWMALVANPCFFSVDIRLYLSPEIVQEINASNQSDQFGSLHHDGHFAAIENFADVFQRRGWLQCLQAICHCGADKFPKRTNSVLDPDENIRFIQQTDQFALF